MGSGERWQPTSSVPPLMLMIGQRPCPTRSRNQVQDSGSHGSPVEPRIRSDERSRPAATPSPSRRSRRMAVGATPRCVMRCFSTISNSRSGFGQFGAPSKTRNVPAQARDADHLPRAHHPADVRQPEHAVAGVDVERVAELLRHLREAAGVRVDGALRLARGARGVEDHRPRLGVEDLDLLVGLAALDGLVPPVVAALDHLHVVAGVPQHDRRARRWAPRRRPRRRSA